MCITYLNRTPISFEFISFAVDSITWPKSPPLLPPLPDITSADLRIKKMRNPKIYFNDNYNTYIYIKIIMRAVLLS